jgi:hypothetical protein
MNLGEHATPENLKRWEERWEKRYGYGRLSLQRDPKAVADYVASYAAKNGEVEIRSTYDDFLEWQRCTAPSTFDHNGDMFPRATPCPKCELVSGCRCEAPNPNQIEMFKAFSAARPEPPTPARVQARCASDSDSEKHDESAAGSPRSNRALSPRRERFLRRKKEFEARCIARRLERKSTRETAKSDSEPK